MQGIKAAVVMLAACVASFAAAAQASLVFEDEEGGPARRTFYGALTAGANFSQVDGDGFSGYHRPGLHAGAMVYVRIAGPLLASVEILYAQKGAMWRAIGNLYASGYDLKLSYAEIPVLLHYRYRPRILLGAGVSYGRLFSSGESAYDNFPVNLYPDVNYFRKSDWCGLAQASWEPYSGWMAMLRWGYSLGSIRDGNRIPQGYGGGRFAGQFNNVFTLRVVYFIRGI